jgi:hypothetical protein
MANFKSLEWYKKHPEIIVRHHGERWTDLQIHVLLLLFKQDESLYEMTHMLGRTEYGILSQLERQKMIWCDATGRIGPRYTYYFRKLPSGYTQQFYNGKK